MPQYLNEYLVKLGFDPDKVGYARFTGMLRDVESQVGNRYFQMAKKVAEFQFATLGAFSAIGAGTLGFMDRVSMADQNYRLFALHMYTSLPVARNLKVALDALGQPLENVMWDPELAARFHQLVEDQQRMTEMLGPDFEKNMLRIRDIRFEFTRFGVELKYLSMTLVNDLFKAFGKGSDDTLANLRHLNEWFTANIPFFSYWISTKLKPMLEDIGNVFKTIFNEVTNIDWNKIAADVQVLVKALAQASEIMVHLVSGAIDLGEGKFKDAWGELKATSNLITPGSGTAIGAAVGFGAFGVPGAIAGGAIGNVAGGWHASASEMGIFAKNMAGYVSKKIGVPEDVILSQWAFETGGFQHLAAPFNLAGIKIPGTDKFQEFKSLSEFADRYSQIIRSYIGRAGGIAPQTIYDFARILEAGPIKYAPDRTAEQYAAGMTSFGDIHITVNANTEASADEIAAKVRDMILPLTRRDTTQKLAVQRNINEFQTPGWSYGQ